MKKSKRTYIHNNVKNITVGIKGKKQFKISKEDLYNDIIKIQEKSRQLSEQYRKNAIRLRYIQQRSQSLLLKKVIVLF